MNFIFFGNTDQALFDFTSLTHIGSGIFIAIFIFLLSEEYKLLRKPEVFFFFAMALSVGWEFWELFQRIIYPFLSNWINGFFLIWMINYFTATESYFNIIGDIISNMLGVVIIYYLFKDRVPQK